MNKIVKKYGSCTILLFTLTLASCSPHTIIPGRSFYEGEHCKVYESVRSGFLSATPSLYIMCDGNDPYEILQSMGTKYYDVSVEVLPDEMKISVDYCNVVEDSRSLHAEDVESNFRAHFDGAQFGGLSLSLDFHEEQSGCREKRFEDYYGFPLSPGDTE